MILPLINAPQGGSSVVCRQCRPFAALTDAEGMRKIRIPTQPPCWLVRMLPGEE